VGSDHEKPSEQQLFAIVFLNSLFHTPEGCMQPLQEGIDGCEIERRGAFVVLGL